MHMHDLNNDGLISYKEFTSLVSKLIYDWLKDMQLVW